MSRVELAMLGGSLRTGSVSARVLLACAELADGYGARASILTAQQLALPLYEPDFRPRLAAAHKLLSVLRRANGVIVVTPTYHGGVSGLLKNALDYVEDLAGDTPAYLGGRAAGTAAVGWSERGAATAVAELRNTMMCLRGWVTPMAVTVNAADISMGDDAVRSDQRVMRRLDILVSQVLDFTQANSAVGRTSPELTLNSSHRR